MNQIDINKAKEYNESVKMYRNMASQLQAEIKVNREQLTAYCNELSQELGIEVTENNLKEVLESQKQKIEAIMNTGNAVINKIKAEQNNTAVNNSVGTPVVNNGVSGANAGMGITPASVGSPQNLFAQQTLPNQGAGVDLNNLASQANTPFFSI